MEKEAPPSFDRERSLSLSLALLVLLYYVGTTVGGILLEVSLKM